MNKSDDFTRNMTHEEKVSALLAEGSRRWRQTDAALATLIQLVTVTAMLISPVAVIEVWKALW